MWAGTALAAAAVLAVPAMARGNMLQNPGFEDGDGRALVAWASSCTGGSIADRDPGLAFTGKASGHIRKVKDGTSHVAAVVFPRVDVQPGGTYTLSGWGRGHVPAGQATLFLYQYGKDDQYLGQGLHSGVPQDTDQWMPLHATDRLRDDCASVYVRFEIYGVESVGEAWADDVFFGPDVAAPPAVSGLTVRVEGGKARLAWAPPPGEAPFAYFVYRSPYPRLEPARDALVGVAREPRFADALPKRAAYYAVVAVSEALNGSAPAVAGPVTPPGVRGEPALAIWTAGPGHRFDEALPEALPAGPKPIVFEAARDEYENAQVLVGAPRVRLSGVEVRAGKLSGPKGVAAAPGLRLLLEEYVALPGTARRVPDPLVPPRAVEIGPGLLRGWWVQVHVPKGCAVGEYRGQLTVSARGQKPVAVPVRLTVWPFAVPRENHYGGAWGIWADQMAQQEGVTVGSPEYERLLRRHLDFFLEHRMVPREVPGGFRSEEGQAWLADPRVASFALPWTFARLPSDQEAAGLAADYAYLREKGWLAKGFAYVTDEPEEKDYPLVASLGRRLHEIAADATALLTEEPQPALYGAVDTWCPITPNFAATRQRCAERQKLGERVWWYVCCGPTPPWANYLLTNDLIDGRVLSWQQVQYNVEGELYWAVTCYPGDVWKSGLGIQPGDGYLCYPGKPVGLDGPVTCARAEVIRDAKEDIEVIWLLRHEAAGKGRAARAEAEAVVAKAVGMVTTDFTHYTKDDAKIAQARRLLAKEITALRGR